jgi:hypothetical protein
LEIVKILSIDPSLRSTGMAVINFNTEKDPSDPTAFKVTDCQVLLNPNKYKRKDAILNMIDMLKYESCKPCYNGMDALLVEGPPAIFRQNASWAAGTISSIAHISGACVALFGVEKAFLFNPIDWNRRKSKEITHANTQMFLGSCDLWKFEKNLKNPKHYEHVLDAASMGLWFIRENYIAD